MEIEGVSALPEEKQHSLDPAVNSVCHSVHLKLNGELDREKLMQLLKKVRLTVPGLIELHFGANDMNAYPKKTESPDGNTHALFSRHQNAHYLKAYQQHPAQLELANFLFSKAERLPTVIDFVNIKSNL
ncbi:hypothetical protein ABB37_04291 [Leptomonas pyrrhocoris]|uniref:Stress-response A/B barrel domain-containing protein n=1 Tax=Leptomonas pyrrhocoris TaxID=157538 RepID=A0A0M9G2K9_LEPPY|nr:hypothetical protein ABB37_04291 [Leptomonas pyrrhocoris]KPA80879.1 hypothetical protein ABB37_04291 [Leptomonas pyrrhocoris]|eukprot:XP_015659318.1 hypothetical protein ABB37_04291 [Leptomonas pyrrhocoris]